MTCLLLERHWERGSDYLSLITLEPTEARKTLEITRDVISGQVTGYEEVNVSLNCLNELSFE